MLFLLRFRDPLSLISCLRFAECVGTSHPSTLPFLILELFLRKVEPATRHAKNFLNHYLPEDTVGTAPPQNSATSWSAQAPESGSSAPRILRQSPHGCFYQLGVLFLGILRTRAIFLWVYIRAPLFLDSHMQSRSSLKQQSLAGHLRSARTGCLDCFYRVGFSTICVVVKIMVPFWVPRIIRHLVFGGPKRRP